MVYELFSNLAFFAIACFILILSGAWTVRALTHISEMLRLNQFFTSFVLIAVSTSLPELFIGISSAINKNSQIALGTIIGSNIVDLTLVAGISILVIKGIKVKDKKIHKNSWQMLLIASLPVLLFLIGNELSRLDGIILLIVFFSGMYYMYTQHRHKKKLMKKEVHLTHRLFSPLILAFSLFALYVSAEKVVFYASNIAIYFHLPPILIGLFIVSIGATLPELVFGIKALFDGLGELALGNLIGSIVVNSTLVLGVTAVINPVNANFILFITSAVFMIITIFIFSLLMESENGFNWKEGIALILLFILFVILELTVKGAIPSASVLV